MLCSKTFVLDCNQYKGVFVIFFVCVEIGEWREDRKAGRKTGEKYKK